ncbi:MAG TPA: histidine kinase [Longimicrobium sp.]|nr:histidine kinase [Longimicrobium sp.]
MKQNLSPSRWTRAGAATAARGAAPAQAEHPQSAGGRGTPSSAGLRAAAEPAPPGSSMRGGRVLLLIAMAWAAAALLHMTSEYAVHRLGGAAVPLHVMVGEPILRCAVLVLETWAIFAITDRFPIQRGTALRNGLIQAGFAIPLVLARILGYHYAGQALGVVGDGVSPQMAVAQLFSRSVVGYLLLVGVAHAVKYAQTVKERELAQSRLETQLVHGQLQALKMQLHPHFLFNTLHAISTLVHSNPDHAERMIASLSEMLRTTLTKHDAQEVTLREELSVLEPYLDIEKTRFGERLTVRVDVSRDLQDAVVPHLLLQPLVENAIRHGISSRPEGGEIAVRARIRAGKLELAVEDDGVGMPAEPRPDGVGLGNTRARLNRLYGSGHAFRIDSVPGATRVTVLLPLRRDAAGALA